MYCLVVYDIDVKRVTKVYKFLKQYLNWIQNSVFEGELTDADFLKVKKDLKKLIDKNTDSVLIFKLRDQYAFKKEILGTEKAPVDNVI